MHNKEELEAKSKGELIDMLMNTKDGDKCGCNCEKCRECGGHQHEDEKK